MASATKGVNYQLSALSFILHVHVAMPEGRNAPGFSTYVGVFGTALWIHKRPYFIPVRYEVAVPVDDAHRPNAVPLVVFLAGLFGRERQTPQHLLERGRGLEHAGGLPCRWDESVGCRQLRG